jgi:hypothetical protein
MQKRRENSISSRTSDRSSRTGKRSISRDGSVSAMESAPKTGDLSAKSNFRGQDMTLKDFLKEKDAKVATGDDDEQ